MNEFLGDCVADIPNFQELENFSGNSSTVQNIDCNNTSILLYLTIFILSMIQVICIFLVYRKIKQMINGFYNVRVNQAMQMFMQMSLLF